MLLCLLWDWSLTVAVPLSEKKFRNARCVSECVHTCLWQQMQEEERYKVLSAQQLVLKKVFRVGKRVSRLKNFLQAPKQGRCCTWCEITTVLVDRSFPGCAVPRVICCMFKAQDQKGRTTTQSIRHKWWESYSETLDCLEDLAHFWQVGPEADKRQMGQLTVDKHFRKPKQSWWNHRKRSRKRTCFTVFIVRA